MKNVNTSNGSVEKFMLLKQMLLYLIIQYFRYKIAKVLMQGINYSAPSTPEENKINIKSTEEKI